MQKESFAWNICIRIGKNNKNALEVLLLFFVCSSVLWTDGRYHRHKDASLSICLHVRLLKNIKIKGKMGKKALTHFTNTHKHAYTYAHARTDGSI